MPERITTLSKPALLALVEHLGVLRHDLGKYIALQSRNSSDINDLEVALRSDLLETRRGPSGIIDAAELWSTLSPPLRGERELSAGIRVDLRGDEMFDRLQAAMEAIGPMIEQLRVSQLSGDALVETAERTREVAVLCSALWKRALEQRAAMDGRDG